MDCNITGGSAPTASQEDDTQINAVKLTRDFYFFNHRHDLCMLKIPPLTL